MFPKSQGCQGAAAKVSLKAHSGAKTAALGKTRALQQVLWTGGVQNHQVSPRKAGTPGERTANSQKVQRHHQHSQTELIRVKKGFGNTLKGQNGKGPSDFLVM